MELFNCYFHQIFLEKHFVRLLWAVHSMYVKVCEVLQIILRKNLGQTLEDEVLKHTFHMILACL